MNRNYWERGEYLVWGLVGGTLGIYLYGRLGLFIGIPVGILVGLSARFFK